MKSMNDTGINKLNYKFLITCAVVIPILFGISYAYFVPKVTLDGGRLVSGVAVEDVHFDLVTENDGYISATDTVPLNNDQIEEYSNKGYFKVISSDINTHSLNYTISLTDINITENIKNVDFKWALECTNDSTKNKTGNFSVINNNQLVLSQNLTLAPKATDNYILKVWIQNTNENQIGILNGSFSGKVSVSAEYIYVQN